MWILLIIKLLYVREIQANLADNVQDLTDNFFANLNADPYLTHDELGGKSIDFIDKQTENYIRLMKTKYGVNEKQLIKRSTEYNNMDYNMTDTNGTYLFDGLSPIKFVIAENSSDIFFIQRGVNTYLVILEKTTITDSIILYEQNHTNYDLIFKEAIGSADILLTFANSYEIFIITSDHKNVIIYIVTDNTLKKMQTLNPQSLSDISIWENSNGLFLGITRSRTTSLIYKWLGKHFDLVHEIITYGARSISSLSIGHLDFLAIANYQYDDGETTTYSEIFKYNIDSEKYESHQKILTNGAIDIKFFSFELNELQESYLVVANSLKAENHIHSSINSIIYKYIDQYFIPFQSIPNLTKEWIGIRASSQEFILISLSEVEGINGYIYDGWRFVKIDLEYEDRNFKLNYSTVGLEKYKGDLILKLEDNGRITLYKLNFFHGNNFKSFHDDILKWCEAVTRETVDFNNYRELNLKTDRFNEFIEEEKLKRDSRQLREEDDYEGIDRDYLKMQDINMELDKQLMEVESIESDMKNYLTRSGVIHISGDVHAENVIFKNEAFFQNNFTVETINGLNRILDDLIRINRDYDFGNERMTFRNIIIEDEINPTCINGEKIENLLYSTDRLDLHDVVIDGKVIFNNGLDLYGEINGISLNVSKVMLVKGDQLFSEALNWNNIRVNNARSNFLNKLNLNGIPINSNLAVISHFENLNVKDLSINGYLNGKDINELNSMALRTIAHVQILDDYSFDRLELNNLFINDNISNTNLKKAVLIDDGEFDLSNQPVLFSGDLVADKIHIRNRINDLLVDKEGKLNVLLKNSDEGQYMSGTNIFEEVTVINPINLQVKINREQFKTMNPIRIVPDEEIIVRGDYNFNGKVITEERLDCPDIKGWELDRTLQDIISDGLQIDNIELPYRFIFKGNLTVDDIKLDSINGLKPSDFVIFGNENQEEILGSKIIKSNLHITGSTTLINVNDIYIADLVNNVFTIDDDQEITGRHQINELITDSINTGRSILGNHLWQDIVTTSHNQMISGTTVVTSSVQIKSLNVNFTDVYGLINKYNFSLMLTDTADFNTTEINVPKTFDYLKLSNLTVEKGVDMTDVRDKLNEYQDIFKIAEKIILPDKLIVEKLEVDGNLNGIRSDDFNKNYMERSGQQIFYGDYFFDTVTVVGEATIVSNRINAIDFRDVIEDTIKINESFYFDHVLFKDEVVSLQPVILHGAISGLDLEAIITSVSDEQSISQITFRDDVKIIGNIQFNGLMNNRNYTNLCVYSKPNPEEPLKSLIITEDAHFLKGPSLNQIDNVTIWNLYQHVWISNREAELNGHIEFEIINFEHEVTLDGLIDNVNITFLSDHYFSKSKNQTVLAHLDFTDGVNFLTGVSASEAQLPGLVSGQDLIEFVRTAILNDVEQIFEDTLFLDGCHIHNLNGDYLVNDLNLPNDVMRYDVANILTGIKRIPTVIAADLIVENHIPIQTIHLVNWMLKSVSKTGAAIKGDCIFDGRLTFLKGLGVVGKVNNITFDSSHVMIRNEGQIISGIKSIYAADFKNIDLIGYLNGVNISELLRRQLFDNEDNLINSDVNLTGTIIANNLNVKGSYNNINLTKLITGLKCTQDLNNYYENYALLLNVSNRIKESLKYRAYYLDHYDIVQYFEKVWDIYYLPYRGCPCLAVTDKFNDRIDIYKWDDRMQSFSEHLHTIKLNGLNETIYSTLLTFEEEDYFYSEYREANKFIGRISSINNTEDIIQNWLTNGTKSIYPFTLPVTMQKCLIFTYVSQTYPDIYCESDTPQPWLELHQQLDVHTTSQISTITIGSIMYIFIIRDETEDEISYISIWKLDVNTKLFNKHQELYLTTANSISTIIYKDICYLAISSGHLQDAEYQGVVQINRFDSKTEKFIHWQDLFVKAPIQVEFAILSSDEVILYVLTDNIIEPLQSYIYEGANGLKLKHAMTTLAKVHKIRGFNTIDGNNFVLGWNNKGTTLIRSYFKGRKIR